MSVVAWKVGAWPSARVFCEFSRLFSSFLGFPRLAFTEKMIFPLRLLGVSNQLFCEPGIFQGSCRVNRLTMPPFSRSVALDPGSTTRCRSVPSYASGLTTAPVCFPWLVRTTHVAGPRPDGPALDAAQPV